MASRTYGAAPKELGIHTVICREMLSYQYLPVKMPGSTALTREQRLSPFDALMGAACCDFVADYGLTRYRDSYVYLTAKHLFQGPECTLNRQGWHCDGFGTDDINYIWCNRTPTVFNGSKFALSDDDAVSMAEMEAQADPENDFTPEQGTILRLDQFVVHRVQQPKEAELRTFAKISISRDRYDLEGNAHNYLLEYDWPMRPRSITRNAPQELRHER